MDSVVVGKLGYRDPLVPVILLLVDEEPEELFDLLVDMLSLVVTLRVIGCRCSNLDSKYLTESAHELGDELHSLVTNYFLQKAVKLPNIVAEEPVTPREVMSDIVRMT